MDLRQPNQHTEEDDAWKKRSIAFANYYTSKRAQEKVEHDFIASRDAKNRTDSTVIAEARAKALREKNEEDKELEAKKKELARLEALNNQTKKELAEKEREARKLKRRQRFIGGHCLGAARV